MITTRKESITPAQAQRILTEHYARVDAGSFNQRTISPARVGLYANDMKRGAWLLQPQPIVIDENGNLVDGQHRLEAVAASGATVEFMVSRGWPAQLKNGSTKVEMIDLIDRGYSRTVGQQLHLHGYQNANNYAAAANAVVDLVSHGNSRAASYATIRTILEDFGLKEHVASIASHIVTNKQFVGYIVGPLAYYRTTRPEKADDFASQYFSMSGVKKYSPAWTLFHWIGRNGTRDRVSVRQSLAACLRAFDAGIETLARVCPTTEAARWLCDTNPKLNRQVKEIAPSQPGRISTIRKPIAK